MWPSKKQKAQWRIKLSSYLQMIRLFLLILLEFTNHNYNSIIQRMLSNLLIMLINYSLMKIYCVD